MKRILRKLTSIMLVFALVFAEASVVTATNLNNSALVHNVKYSAATVRPGIDVSSWQVLWSSFFVTLRPNSCHRVYETP